MDSEIEFEAVVHLCCVTKMAFKNVIKHVALSLLDM